jgi:carbonic anhydrase
MLPLTGSSSVIIVGHTECGGAVACLGAFNSNQDVTVATFPANSPLNRWLAPMLSLTRSLSLTDVPHTEALVRVVEANVERQVENLCKAEPITRAWSSQKKVWVHGLVYEVGSGTLRDLGLTKGPTVEAK